MATWGWGVRSGGVVAAGFWMNRRPFAGPTVILNAPLSAVLLFEDARSVYEPALSILQPVKLAKPRRSVFSGFVVQASVAPAVPVLIASRTGTFGTLLLNWSRARTAGCCNHTAPPGLFALGCVIQTRAATDPGTELKEP